jgi:hypothetical protein
MKLWSCLGSASTTFDQLNCFRANRATWRVPEWILESCDLSPQHIIISGRTSPIEVKIVTSMALAMVYLFHSFASALGYISQPLGLIRAVQTSVWAIPVA